MFAREREKRELVQALAITAQAELARQRLREAARAREREAASESGRRTAHA